MTDPSWPPPSPGAPPPYYPPGSYTVPVEPAYDEPYAHWGRRVAATLIDGLLQLPFLVAVAIGGIVFAESTTFSTDSEGVITHVDSGPGTWIGVVVAAVSYLAMTVFTIWNQIFRQGRLGASIGKQSMQIMVVSEADGQPIGALMTFVRSIVHIIDGLACYVGYLWPLWDAKRQTFADMIMKTVVLHLPPLPPEQAAQSAPGEADAWRP